MKIYSKTFENLRCVDLSFSVVKTDKVSGQSPSKTSTYEVVIVLLDEFLRMSLATNSPFNAHPEKIYPIHATLDLYEKDLMRHA